jgi:hypothetical protein
MSPEQPIFWIWCQREWELTDRYNDDPYLPPKCLESRGDLCRYTQEELEQEIRSRACIGGKSPFPFTSDKTRIMNEKA